MLMAILVARALGVVGVEALGSWHAATRAGLAVMFLFTSMAHFNRMRPDLVRMVPKRLPAPAILVTLTGIAELVGAIGLLVQPFSRLAAIGLALLLVALFPANVHAARAGLTLGGRPATPLVLRLPLQVLWIGLLCWVAM
jgi:uncharacterized membrane protein